MAYKLSKVAQDDLDDILIYWLRTSLSREITNRVERTLRAKCRQLGQNPYLGIAVEETIGPLRGANAVDARFGIYYKVRGPRSIEVVMIRDNRQPRPTPNELNSRI